MLRPLMRLGLQILSCNAIKFRRKNKQTTVGGKMTRNIAGDKYFPKVSRGFWRHLVHTVDMMSQHARNDSTQAILSFTRSRRRTFVNYFFLVYRKWRVCTVEVSSKGSWSFWERELTNQSESFRYFFELDFLREKKFPTKGKDCCATLCLLT